MTQVGDGARRRWPAQRQAQAAAAERDVLRFGLDAPRRPGDFGLVVENGMAWLVRALPADEGVKRPSRGEEEPEIHLQRLMPADALRVRGRHNAANALAALALATRHRLPAGADAARPARIPRRAAPRAVRGHGGEVEAYDDSKGTNVGATVAALRRPGADKAPGRLVVILGGDGKGQDFTPLAAPLRATRARWPRSAATPRPSRPCSHDTACRCQRHATLEAAVAWCFEQARPATPCC
jgi:UDP-N-acetylmuramoylalanine--D-glutamate ligase